MGNINTFEFRYLDEEPNDYDFHMSNFVSFDLNKASFESNNGNISLYHSDYGFVLKMRAKGKVTVNCKEEYVAKRMPHNKIGLFKIPVENKSKDEQFDDLMQSIDDAEKEKKKEEALTGLVNALDPKKAQEQKQKQKQKEKRNGIQLNNKEERKDENGGNISSEDEATEEKQNEEESIGNEQYPISMNTPNNKSESNGNTNESLGDPYNIQTPNVDSSHNQNPNIQNNDDEEDLGEKITIDIDNTNLNLLLQLISNDKMNVKLTAEIESSEFLDREDKKNLKSLLKALSSDEIPDPLYCSNCGHLISNPNNQDICEKCGTKIRQ